MKFGIFRAHLAARSPKQALASNATENARLWADAARVTPGDPRRHNPKATVKQQEMDF
jgi:hypothetical protein